MSAARDGASADAHMMFDEGNPETNEQRTLVVGATGNIGGSAVRQLLEAGRSVRALVRDPLQKARFDERVEVVTGDLAAPRSLERAFADVRAALVVVPTTTPAHPELEANAYSAALAAGTRHIVKISGVPVMAAGPFADTPVSRWHQESEDRLRGLGIAWTILRPATFASNLTQSFGLLQRKALFLPAGLGRDTPIDPRDIAAVAVAALTAAGHDGMTYHLTGPERLTYAEMVEIVSTVTGEPLRYVEVPEEVWRADMLAAGVGAPAVESLVGYFACVREDRMPVTKTVSDVLGRAPFTFRDWVRDHVR